MIGVCRSGVLSRLRATFLRVGELAQRANRNPNIVAVDRSIVHRASPLRADARDREGMNAIVFVAVDSKRAVAAVQKNCFDVVRDTKRLTLRVDIDGHAYVFHRLRDADAFARTRRPGTQRVQAADAQRA